MFLCVLYSWRESSRVSRKDCMLCSSPDEGAGFEFNTVPERNKAGCVFRAVLCSSAVLKVFSCSVCFSGFCFDSMQMSLVYSNGALFQCLGFYWKCCVLVLFYGFYKLNKFWCYCKLSHAIHWLDSIFNPNSWFIHWSLLSTGNGQLNFQDLNCIDCFLITHLPYC